MEEMNPIIINLLYAAMGGGMLIVFNWIAGHLFRNIMGFSVRDQLAKGNVAVGLALMGIFIGLGVGLGLVIGLSLN